MLFDHCAVCQSCCRIDPGYPSLEITLTANEEDKFQSICIENRCPHLGPNGCREGNDKPFGCFLYPLSFNPLTNSFMFDSECPLKPTYFAQLDDPASEASAHLKMARKQITELKKNDQAFLLKNHSVDITHFDLVTLPKKKR